MSTIEVQEPCACEGHCKNCKRSLMNGWFCIPLNCWTEPSGPNYGCGLFEEK